MDCAHHWNRRRLYPLSARYDEGLSDAKEWNGKITAGAFFEVKKYVYEKIENNFKQQDNKRMIPKLLTLNVIKGGFHLETTEACVHSGGVKNCPMGKKIVKVMNAESGTTPENAVDVTTLGMTVNKVCKAMKHRTGLVMYHHDLNYKKN